MTPTARRPRSAVAGAFAIGLSQAQCFWEPPLRQRLNRRQLHRR
jgi:hypothetical protein